jgi:hypothetical protein
MSELPYTNFRGSPPVVAGMSTPNTSQMPAQYKAVIDFFEVLSRTNAKTTQQRRLVAALKRLLSSSMSDIKGFSESMLLAIAQVRSLGVAVPDGSFVNNGSVVYEVTDNELLAAVFKGSIHTVRVTPNLIDSLVSIRSLISDLKMMTNMRQWIVEKADYMMDTIKPWVNGTIDISRAVMKEQVLKTAQSFNPWLRLKSSSKWWALIKELDEAEVEECEFIEPLDAIFSDLTSGESYSRAYRDRVDIGLGQAPPPPGFEYLDVSDGKGALLRDSSGDTSVKEYTTKELNFSPSYSPPMRVKGHPWFVVVSVDLVDESIESSVEYDINGIVSKLDRGDPLHVTVRASVSDVQSLTTNPRLWYNGTLVRVQDAGIMKITADVLEGDRPEKIRVLLKSELREVQPVLTNL